LELHAPFFLWQSGKTLPFKTSRGKFRPPAIPVVTASCGYFSIQVPPPNLYPYSVWLRRIRSRDRLIRALLLVPSSTGFAGSFSDWQRYSFHFPTFPLIAPPSSSMPKKPFLTPSMAPLISQLSPLHFLRTVVPDTPPPGDLPGSPDCQAQQS